MEKLHNLHFFCINCIAYCDFAQSKRLVFVQSQQNKSFGLHNYVLFDTSSFLFYRDQDL